MTTFVTGATGFVGSAILRLLIDRGEAVRALARANSDRRNLDGLSVEIVEGDMTDRASLDRGMRGCDSVFHVAADYRLWVPVPEEIYTANVEGTRNIMRAAGEAGVSRIVYTSSVATLGHASEGRPADEDTPVDLSQMIGHYKRSKFLAEAEVRRMAEEDGLPAVIVNPSTPVGPRDIKPTPTGRMIVQAASGKIPAFVATGLNLVNVEDVAEGHVQALERGVVGQRYVLGAENLTLRDILIRIADLSGHKPPRLSLPRNLVLPIAYIAEAWARLTNGAEPLVTVDGVRLARYHMFFSHEKARRDLNFRPRPVAEGLRDAVGWFRDNGYLT